MARWMLVCLAALTSAAALAPSAGAIVVPGPNGPLIFTSGRDEGLTTLSDMRAQIWFLGNGSATRLTTLSLSHYRHASWSPDRTKIAYARGPSDNNPFDGPWDIYIQDLTTPGSTPVPITNTATTAEDRPSWSPDGTRLAYAKQDPATPTVWDIVTHAAAAGGGEVKVAEDVAASGQFGRPQWTPDGQQIYFGRLVAMNNHDIYRSPAGGGNVIGTPIVTGAGNDYQPSLSPDGTKLCFTRDTVADKNVVVFPLGGGAPILDLAPGGVDYECAWSPDGQRIAFTRGAFGAGEVRVRNSNATETTGELTDVVGRFDGNADWTYNPSPSCTDGTASVAFNAFVPIFLSCTDAPDPLDYEPHGVFEEIVTPPANGDLGALEDEMVIYTPSADFRGSDSFTFKANDGTSNSPIARIDITVGGPGTGGGGGPGAANVVSLSVSPKRFRRGRRLPTASQTPVGTTIGVGLSARGRVALTFRRARPGRRVRGRCVKPTRQNRSRRRCKRYVKAGTLRFDGERGVNTVRFQGRISRRKTLPIGRYRLAATVTADGRTSPARAVSLRIVRR